MTYPMMQHIPLNCAYLCQDCNSIGNCATQCPACASTVLMSLSGVLNREEAFEVRRELTFPFPKPIVAARTGRTAMVA
jgi:hypothetical protein